MRIITTKEWGAEPPRGDIEMLDEPGFEIVVHHTATSNVEDTSPEQAENLARSIQQWHFQRGWCDSGQQFTISRGGYVLEGRHQSLEALTTNRFVIGAHVRNHNHRRWGIENEGLYMTEEPPSALWEALVELCVLICHIQHIDSTAIHGHREYVPTDCPGDRLFAQLNELRDAVHERLVNGQIPDLATEG